MFPLSAQTTRKHNWRACRRSIIPCSRAGAIADDGMPVGWPATAVSRPTGRGDRCGCGTGPGSWSGPAPAPTNSATAADGGAAAAGTDGRPARTAPVARRR